MEIGSKDQANWRGDAPTNKTATSHLEYLEMNGDKLDTSSVESAGYDAAATKRLTRKIDWNLLPFLALLYLLSFLGENSSPRLCDAHKLIIA